MALTLLNNKNYSSWLIHPWPAGRFGILDAIYAPVDLYFRGYWLADAQVEAEITQALKK